MKNLSLTSGVTSGVDDIELEDLYEGGVASKDLATAPFSEYGIPKKWSEGVEYVKDAAMIQAGSLFYVPAETHVSSSSFTTDLAAGKWRLHKGLDVKTGVKEFENFSQMSIDSSLFVGQKVRFRGWWQAGDFGGNDGVIVPAGTGGRAQACFDLTSSTHQVMLLFPDGAVRIRQFGIYHDALEVGRHDDGPIWHDAIQYIHDNNLSVLNSFNDDCYFSSKAELLEGVKIFAKNSTIHVDGVSLKIPFTTQAHCENDFDAFAYGCEIHGLGGNNESELPAGTQFVNQMLWHAFNVRDWRMEGCSMHNMGGAYVTHARRKFGTYTADMNANNNKLVDPAVTAGFSPTGGDLNKNLHFNDNYVYVDVREDGLKTIIQAFRHEFCENVQINDNETYRAAISGWGGSAIPEDGGAPQNYRRCRDVRAIRNFLYEPNALYWIQGYNVKTSLNTIMRGIDLGIDFEGCQNCQSNADTVIGSGNGSFGTFYHCQNIQFSNGICYEDGSTKDINDEFDLGTKWDPSNGNTFFINTGAHAPEEGEDEVYLVDNLMVWGGETGSGNIDIRDVTDFVGRGNKLLNVTFDSEHDNTGRVQWVSNEMIFTQNAEVDQLVRMGNNETGKFGPACADNSIYLGADQLGPSGYCDVMSFMQGDNDNFITRIARNDIIHDGSQRTTHDVSIENLSVNGGRWHTYFLLDNNFGCDVPLIDRSTRNTAHAIVEEGNRRYKKRVALYSHEDNSGEAAFYIDSWPRGFALMSGQKFRYQDFRGMTNAALMTANHGWDLTSDKVFEVGNNYTQGDVCYTSTGHVYWCLSSGTSTTEPSGTYPTDGALTWTRLGDRCEWVEAELIGSTVER